MTLSSALPHSDVSTTHELWGLFVWGLVLMPLASRVIPPTYLGRATVTLTVFPTMASLVAMAAAGWLVSTVLADLDITAVGMRFGPVDTIFLLSGMVIAVTGLLVAGPIRRAQAAPVPCAERGEI